MEKVNGRSAGKLKESQAAGVMGRSTRGKKKQRHGEIIS